MAEFVLVSRHRPSAADTPLEGTRRFRLDVEFDGTAYCGWQRQENGPSVQQALEEALERLTGVACHVTGSSRTDAGVHARGMACHLDSGTRIPPEKLAFALNTLLPEDIRVRESSLAPAGFHARYAACGKVYAYRIWNARHAPAIGRQYMSHVPLPLDVPAMDGAVKALVGTHDFSAFAASGSVANSCVRTLYMAQVRRDGQLVTFTVLGDGFLYNMVRIIAGTLIEIGAGKRDAGCLTEAIHTGDRLCLGVTAPAKGLTLEAALYAGDEEKAISYFT